MEASETGPLLREEEDVPQRWGRHKAVGAVGIALFALAAVLQFRRVADGRRRYLPAGTNTFMQAQEQYGAGVNGATMPAGYNGQGVWSGWDANQAQNGAGADAGQQPQYGAGVGQPQQYGAGVNGAAMPSGYNGQGVWSGWDAQAGAAGGIGQQPMYGEGVNVGQQPKYGASVQTAEDVAAVQAAMQAQAAGQPPAAVAPAAAAAPIASVAVPAEAPPTMALPAQALPAEAPPVEAPPVDAEALPAEEQPQCSWEGDNCVNSKCCKRVGLTCWEKMKDTWGGCSKSCEDLKKFGGDWTCEALGPAGAPILAPQGDSEPTSVSLFCFMVVTPQGICPPGVKEGYEQQLVDELQKAKLSVFACEASAVYQGERATTGEWKSIKNTDAFVQVWKNVQADGIWEQHDWTVKADSDAVFFPERLKMHIQGSKPKTDTPIYYHNIDFKFHFMGALEVLSKDAVDLFLKNLDVCSDKIGDEGGEDIFTMSCLDAIGANYMEDYSLLDDKYSNPAAFNLFDIDRCSDDAIVAFHPYKAVNSWMGCYKVATGEVDKGQFTSCEHRWEGEACSLSGDLDHPGQADPGTGIVA